MMKCPAGSCRSHQELASSEASCREVDDEDDGLALRLQRGVMVIRCHSDSLFLVETCVIWIMSSCLRYGRQQGHPCPVIWNQSWKRRSAPEIPQRSPRDLNEDFVEDDQIFF